MTDDLSTPNGRERYFDKLLKEALEEVGWDYVFKNPLSHQRKKVTLRDRIRNWIVRWRKRS